jgi:hypothetical protein
MHNEQREPAVQELDNRKVVREPTAALVMALLLLVIPLIMLYILFRK